jgi:ribosomal protein L4
VLCHIEWDGEEGETIVEDISLHVPSKQIVHATLQTLTEKMANVTVDEHEKLKIKLDASTVEFSAFKQTKEYKQLIEKGVKIQLQKKIVKEVNTTDDKNDFLETLERLVEDDETLVRSLYHEVLFDKLVI